jgi:putative hemolysin
MKISAGEDEEEAKAAAHRQLKANRDAAVEMAKLKYKYCRQYGEETEETEEKKAKKASSKKERRRREM